MHRGFRRPPAVLWLAIVPIATVAAVLVWAPWYLAFATSVGLAVAWCLWLERHPAP